MTPELQQEYNELKREADEETFDEVHSLKKEQELLDAAKDNEKIRSENFGEMQEEEARLENEIKAVRLCCRSHCHNYMLETSFPLFMPANLRLSLRFCHAWTQLGARRLCCSCCRRRSRNVG